jgi:hypothetical protein
MTLQDAEDSRTDIRGEFLDLKKHYVRVHGWLPAFQKYSKAKKRKVQYLTLCAKQAIDVRYFALKGLLYRNKERNEYPSLTFIESNDEDYAAIAEALGKVRLGVRGRLEDVLLDEQDASHDDLVQSFPYDVVNLDFCGDIVPREDHPYSETLRCITRIVELQAAYGQAEWHMFLTFRAQQARGHEGAHGELCDIVEGNLHDATLKAAYGEREAPDVMLRNDYPEFLRIGICKLLAHIARVNGYRMALDGTFSYSRHKGAYHIVKVVAGFDKIRKSLPNPHEEQSAYQGSVKCLFESSPQLVERVLGGVRELVNQELLGVLSELSEARIVP